MIRLNNLRKDYKDFKLDVSMEVPGGRVTGLIGKNGAGKTTTIKAILGLIKTDGGEIEVFGKNPKDFTGEDKKQFGVALSDAGFPMILTITDVISILKGFYEDFDEKDFTEKCKAQSLPFDKAIKDFSSGMKAKLRVITAMSHKASVLILDEPTAGLDVLARNDVLQMIRDYLGEDPDRSVIISSHISSDLEGLCDDIYMIDNGKIILHEDTDVLLGNYGLVKVGEEEYGSLDKKYILASQKDSYSYTCLTSEKQFYVENYPKAVVENAHIDDIIVLMLGGGNK
ncbi:MAG: ABC transporter ATP-binding protein [Lachnospiraceae bacterium]|nr:ABC transporter ATP-binding protein [Lachnospiraceae bacterium]